MRCFLFIVRYWVLKFNRPPTAYHFVIYSTKLFCESYTITGAKLYWSAPTVYHPWILPRSNVSSLDLESPTTVEEFHTSHPTGIFCIPVLFQDWRVPAHITYGNFLYSRISDFLPVSHLTGGVCSRTERLHNETPDDSTRPNFVQYRSNFHELFSSMSIC